MNILLILTGLILAWRIAEGFRHGMVKEIMAFVTLLVAAVSAVLLFVAVNDYLERNYVNMIVAIILLLVLSIVYRLIHLVLFSAKLMSKLPVVHTFDRILGGVIGVFETLIGIWVLFSLLQMFDMGVIGEQILLYVKQSRVLTAAYEYNYLAKWVIEAGNAIVNLPGLPKWELPEMKLPELELPDVNLLQLSK